MFAKSALNLFILVNPAPIQQHVLSGVAYTFRLPHHEN
jgi:hypothetical protein